jgi:flagellin-like hook-associated protein FlgL
MEEKDLTYSNLVKKDKAELDRLKAVLEIATFREKYEFDKRKHRMETVRLFAIALMSSVITLGTTYIFRNEDRRSSQIDKSTMELKDLKSDYASHLDPKLRKEFACQIAQIHNPQQDAYVESEKKRFQEICLTISAAQETITAQVSTITGTDTISAENNALVKELKNLEKKINGLQIERTNAKTPAERRQVEQDLRRADEQINAIADSSAELKTAIQAAETINDNVRKQIEAVTEETGGSYEVKWFKEGYFLQFGELRVLLQYLDKKLGIQVQVCHTTETTPCKSPLINKAWITYDKPLDFQYENNRYRISLKAIDRAGRNPFNLAAYIGFEKVR